MYLIGLTGGIASGKSVVAKRLAEHGAIHVDADVLAREVVEPGTPGLASIREEFGDGVITPEGTLDRAALGAIIFADPDARGRLNAITHPAVWALAKEQFAAAGPADVVVYDVPLLVEASADRPMRFDLIVVVHASIQTRLQRLMELRGLSREEAMHRLNSQASDTERLAIADVVIDAEGTLEHSLEQADELWAMASAAAVSAS
jgi:dephospho-CoA kinase